MLKISGKLVIFPFIMLINIMNMLAYARTLENSPLKTPSEITFDGATYKQASQDGDGVTTDRVTTYLRKGESLNNYTSMLAIWSYPNVRDVNKFAGNLIKAHQKNYPLLPRQIFAKDDGSEVLVNFISGATINNIDITEFNIFRLFKMNGQVVAYQYVNTNRSPLYSSSNTKWYNELKKNKSKWIDLMTKVNYIK